jgi:TetR/AcrR family transcriptional repressor of bet genes
LIDACISALHIHGPSRTTVEKVVAIARMSPGIVRFYFDSKAAMLVASLQFLAAEFEEQVLVPVSRLKHDPVAGLELLVDLYLDPEIASPRKVSVWYAFWGEASSRQEYYDICGQKDESFAALVRELIRRLIEESGRPQLDSDGIALGLIGALEMQWQDFAFRSENDIDRQAAKRRCMAYLKSIFPGRFSPLPPGRGGHRAAPDATGGRFAGWVYGHERAWSLEREALFQGVWQIAAHESQLAHAGDFLTADFAVERVVLVRDAFGAVHALRNSCPEVPHALVTERSGRFAGGHIECRLHGLEFALDGARAAGTPGAGSARNGLGRLAVELAGGLFWVGPRDVPRTADEPLAGLDAALRDGPTALAEASEIEVAANWKLLVEQWLASAAPESAPTAAAPSITWTSSPLEGAASWSRQRYRGLAAGAASVHAPSAHPAPAHTASAPWVQRFIAPNQLLQARPDGLSILQAIPGAAGRCRLRRLQFARGGADPSAHARAYLAARITPWARGSSLKLAESAQRGVIEFGYRASTHSAATPALTWFRRRLLERVPALAEERPPTDS